MSQKKCPQCGEWSVWTNDYRDRCEHCGEFLSPDEMKREERKAQDQERYEKEWMFYVNPEDSAIVRFFKKSGNLFYTVFMAIMTFIMWLIAALPG
ncbi:hypothetical protein PBT90_17320 [Algoriphagus halophytocola]|uniref:TFIIB-type zinc ribbon-containing protein n=1 Tax=Algoriphagus halophytocola TaxID=2991499 RepID=A0ABY6MF73_9BACT|nr:MULTISPECIES: hypothetical protein [unclassified Algoriphagus]UZD21286.1 hypothetical protein OM944_11455 [Algoriphagus sp. TR-M5]WBL42497.1 hypothetical protein PBT90_17320 [Algoriphagus sp. TR-M9]